MKRATHLVLAVLMLVFIGAAANPVWAEWFVDAYVGAAFTREEVTARVAGISATAEGDSSSFTGGGRIGYYFEGIPWLGVAFDASAFKAEEDVTVVPLSPLVMLRWPLLTSQELPKGQLQPYLGIGPGIFISRATASAVGGTVSDTTVDVGLDVRAGLSWQFVKNLALFGEYRFSYVRPDFDGNILGLATKFETKDTTHHILGGVSFRF
jgi:opacity protein-like surface antigen